MRILRAGALFLGILILVIGFLTHQMWAPVLTAHAIGAAEGIAILLAAALILSRVTGFLPWMLAVAIALVPLIQFQGLAAVLSAVLLLLAAIGVGTAVVPDRHREPLVATMAGLAIIAGAAGWLLPFPVFSVATVGGALLLIVVVRWRAIAAAFRTGLHGEAMAAAGDRWGALGLAVAIAASTAPAWLPVLMSDDLSTHLQIPTQLSEAGVYRLDVGSQVWSLAPWMVDVCHGLVTLVGGSESVGPLNIAWLVITALLVRRLGRMAGLSNGLAWLGAVLYVTIPMTGALTMSMQTETATAAGLAALAAVVMESGARPDTRTTILVAVLSAFLLGTKVINLVFLGPALLWLAWQWRTAVPWRLLPLMGAVVVAVGGSSFAYSAVLARNPVLPLFNDVFRSPWFPTDRWVDTSFVKGFNPLLPYDLTFKSGEYFEGVQGAGGFVVLALLGGLLPALWNARIRPLMLVAAAAWILPLSQLQYLRYAHPSMVLVVPALLAGLATVSSKAWLSAAALAVSALQVAFLPSASWILNHDALPLLLDSGRDAVMKRFAPERLVAKYQREHLTESDRTLIVATGNAYMAEFGRHAFVMNWYDTGLQHHYESAPTEADGWQRVIEQSGANHVLVRDGDATPALLKYLTDAKAPVVASFGGADLYRLPNQAAPGEVEALPANHIGVKFILTRDHPILFDARVELACNRPSAPYAFSWTMPDVLGADRKPVAKYEWLTCGLDGRAVAEVAVAAPPRSGPIYFNVSPVDETKGDTVTLVSHWGQIRRDLAAERDLSARVRSVLCRLRFCRIDSPRVLFSHP
ncbi:MAG TPA: hypothetical protein VN700_10865 [Vicinamibacterales bacterium]|nr:hypothetical protein [Vicinamibacterales bacterium]